MEPHVEIVVPPAVPTQTVTLEVREEFRWPGWNHGPYHERVTYTRSHHASKDLTTRKTIC